MTGLCPGLSDHLLSLSLLSSTIRLWSVRLRVRLFVFSWIGKVNPIEIHRFIQEFFQTLNHHKNVICLFK